VLDCVLSCNGSRMLSRCGPLSRYLSFGFRKRHFFTFCISASGTAVAQWLRCCATNRKVAGSIPAFVSGFFIDIKFFRSHYGPGVYSASSRNEWRPVRKGDNLPPSCAVVTKYGNLNFLESSGTVQAYNGTALPFYISF